MTGRVILQHEGRAEISTTSRVIAEAAPVLDRLDEHRATKRRLLRVIIESIQNVIRHGITCAPTSTERTFAIRVTVEREGYAVVCGNAVRKAEAAHLKERIQAINALGRDGLKELYQRTLQSTTAPSDGGAGLGFVDMARRSGKKLLFEFQEMSEDCCFFRMEVTVSRCNKSMSK